MNLDRYKHWYNLGHDSVYTDRYGSITGVVKPVRNQVTGKLQTRLYDPHRRPPDRKGA